ncbi:hypothetical protein Tco_1210819 [Tanacetum coccineum]
MTEEKDDGGEGLYVGGRSGQRDMEYVPELRRNLILLGTLEKKGFIMKMQSDKIKRSTQQCTKSEVAKRLGVVGIYQQNGLVEETNVTLLAKVVLYRNMGFNESGEYKKTFIGSGVGTGSVQVLQGVKFEVEPHEDHTFEVEPHGNIDHVAGSQEVQTQDLIYYHLARDREQHSTHELFSYREDNNETAFAVAVVDKIYAHELLTFNNTVACKVISMWKAGLKDDMDAQSDVYVLNDMVFSCGCKAENWATKGLLDKAEGNVLGMEIVMDQSDDSLRVSQSRFYNGKLVQTLLKGHSILSMEGSLSGDSDVEKKWFLWILTMPWEDRSLSWVDQSQAGYMTLTDAVKEAIWINGLLTESRAKLMSAAIFLLLQAVTAPLRLVLFPTHLYNKEVRGGVKGGGGGGCYGGEGVKVKGEDEEGVWE